MPKKGKKNAIWKIEQMVNFGLENKKLKEKDLKKHWTALKIDPKRKSFLKFLMNG